MRSLASRLTRLEREARTSGPWRITVQYGNLKTLPDDYTGLRHVVAVRQIPPEELPAVERAENWFDWEERPGPEPVSNATGPDDGLLIHVCYVETPPVAARRGYR